MGAVKIRRKTENRSPDTREKITSRFKMSGSRVPVTMRDFFFDDPFFKNSWEDFDKVRNAMFTESRDMWKKFDDDFRNMACMSRWENGWMFPRRWMLPALNTDFSNNVDIFKSKMFSRKYTLPPSTKQEEVASNLSSDGVLVITAPK